MKKKKSGERLIRNILIILKLFKGNTYTPTEELISYINIQMKLRGYEPVSCLRTIQRDICDIDEMFNIVIKNRRGKGYYIVNQKNSFYTNYEDFLFNFDLLNYLNQCSGNACFIIPEHHRSKGIEIFSTLIQAIKTLNTIRFDYKLLNQEKNVISKTIKPHFLKESSGVWYVVGVDDTDKLSICALDQISNLEILNSKFKRVESLDLNSLFHRESWQTSL